MIRAVFAGFFAYLIISMSACTLFVDPNTGTTVGTGNISTADLQKLQQVFMSSYYASSEGTPAISRGLTPFSSRQASQLEGSSRATVPINNSSAVANTNFSNLVSNSAAANTISNYPQTGESTSFTVTSFDATFHVYKIKATTVFPTSDERASYVEEYYVRDGGFSGGFYSITAFDGVWTTDDPIVSNATGSWVQNQNARIQMLLTFTDGTTRNEYIISNNLSGGPKFAPFNISGSLDLSQSFVPSPTTDPSILYTSVVVYETHPATNPNFWFWAGSQAQTIVGIRYYTEQLSGSTYTGTSVSFEKAVSSNTTTGGSYAAALTTVAGGTQWNTLAESVLREKISWPYSSGAPVLSQATITRNMQTRVINVTGQQAFYVQQLNADYASISSFSTTAAYAPVGVVDQVLAAQGSTPLLYTRDQITTGVNGGLPLATETVSSSLGTMAIVYRAIQEGALATGTSTATPTSNVLPANTSWTFNGQQSAGNSITPSTSYKLGKTGTVEAWVYFTTLTDTMGIVHYGSRTDFADEGYSLQGWSNTGQISMIVDSANGVYDQVLSKQLLATGQWYHIVGVWDVTNGNHYISLYINGKLDKTNSSLSVINPNGSQAATEAVPNPQVLIGSQLPSAFNAQYGYFGLNGKIVGVNISTTVYNAATILANYNASKNNTGGW